MFGLCRWSVTLIATVAAGTMGTAWAQAPLGSSPPAAAATVAATVDAPALRILKGELVEWNVRGLSGDLLLEEDEAPRRWRCAVTADTYLTRASIRIHPAGVRIGDLLEVVADTQGDNDSSSSRGGGGGAAAAAAAVRSACIARTVYIRPPDPRRRLSGRQLWLTSTPASSWLGGARGVLTFAGVVNRVEGNRLYLNTRRQGAKSFVIRDDTKFSSDGRPVDLAALPAQTQVFIRASKTYEGDLEVYHVVWRDALGGRSSNSHANR